EETNDKSGLREASVSDSREHVVIVPPQDQDHEHRHRRGHVQGHDERENTIGDKQTFEPSSQDVPTTAAPTGTSENATTATTTTTVTTETTMTTAALSIHNIKLINITSGSNGLGASAQVLSALGQNGASRAALNIAANLPMMSNPKRPVTHEKEDSLQVTPASPSLSGMTATTSNLSPIVGMDGNTTITRGVTTATTATTTTTTTTMTRTESKENNASNIQPMEKQDSLGEEAKPVGAATSPSDGATTKNRYSITIDDCDDPLPPKPQSGDGGGNDGGDEEKNSSKTARKHNTNPKYRSASNLQRHAKEHEPSMTSTIGSRDEANHSNSNLSPTSHRHNKSMLSQRIKKFRYERYTLTGKDLGIHAQVMIRILCVYARLNKGIDYVQGMNELVTIT
ncbi:hypothetical protein RFI_20000, partial [Reticulomyxa filosa]